MFCPHLEVFITCGRVERSMAEKIWFPGKCYWFQEQSATVGDSVMSNSVFSLLTNVKGHEHHFFIYWPEQLLTRWHMNKSARNILIATVYSQVLKLVIINDPNLFWMIWRRAATNMAFCTDRHIHMSLVIIGSSFNIRIRWILKGNSWEYSIM